MERILHIINGDTAGENLRKSGLGAKSFNINWGRFETLS